MLSEYFLFFCCFFCQHLLCLILQALACMALSPSLHSALTQADVPDTLMQLLLPSDEWYYTNHSTRYAHYVKYHAARILVYMGLFHRLGGRVHLFHLKSKSATQNIAVIYSVRLTRCPVSGSLHMTFSWT